MISKVKFGKMPKLIMNYKISIEENELLTKKRKMTLKKILNLF